MQTARTSEDDGLAFVDAGVGFALGVEIGELAAQGCVDVFQAGAQVGPRVRHRVFEVKHHSGRAGVEHLHHEFGIVRLALVGAPRGQRDRPV